MKGGGSVADDREGDGGCIVVDDMKGEEWWADMEGEWLDDMEGGW